MGGGRKGKCREEGERDISHLVSGSFLLTQQTVDYL